METPLVSVITVTCNSARFVRGAMESVLRQSYPAIEYIVGDDASTDRTWAIIEEFSDIRIKAYRNETNLGEYANRNKAISLATGKFIIFVDGDDLIHGNGVEFFVKMARAYPEAALVVQKGYFNNVVFPVLLEPDVVIRNYYLGKNCLLSSSFVSNFFVTSVLKQKPLETSFASGDEEVRLRIAAEHPTLFVPGWVTWPRETPNQASSLISDERRLLERLRCTTALAADLAGGEMGELLKEACSVVRRQLCRHALRLLLQGRVRVAARLLSQAGVDWRSLVSGSQYRTSLTDPIARHSPSDPLMDQYPRNGLDL